MMQNHYVISSKYHFWTRNVPNWIKTLTSVMSGPAKTCPGGQVLTANQRKYFQFFRFYTFPFFINKLYILHKIICFTKQIYIFHKIIGFIKRIYHFYKIISFTKQIYEYKSLSPNPVFTFEISRFTILIFLLIVLWFFIKIKNFWSKIGPLWAHKGPYGPIRVLMGP